MAVNPALVDTTTAMAMFDSIARMEYQNRQNLYGIGTDRDMMGTSLEIPVIGQVEMLDRAFSSGDLPITNIVTRSVVLEPNDFALKSAIGDSNASIFAYDKVDMFARAHILGASRQVDSVKLSGITGNTYSGGNNNQVAKNTATGTSTGLTVDQLVEAQSLLEENGYDIRDNLYLVGNVRAIKNVFHDNKFTDWDYRPARPYSLAPVDQFDMLLGYSMRKLGSRGNNKIAVSGGSEETKIYAIAGDALVNGYNKRLHSTIADEPGNLRTVIATGLVMGSTTVHPGGIIEITVDQIPTIN